MGSCASRRCPGARVKPLLVMLAMLLLAMPAVLLLVLVLLLAMLLAVQKLAVPQPKMGRASAAPPCQPSSVEPAALGCNLRGRGRNLVTEPAQSIPR
jgi:hypothetical protein